jgi:hypothetical protein
MDLAREGEIRLVKDEYNRLVYGYDHGAVAICVGMIPALPSGINLSDHAARSMI